MLSYTAAGDLGGNGVRIFKIEDAELYVVYDKAAQRTVFLMKDTDAQAHLCTLADERASEEKLPFNATKFLNIVATA